MDDDAFVNGIPDEKEPGRRKLKTKPGASSEELTSTQKAIQTLSRTSAASANVNGTGSAADRRLVVGRMDMSAFQLDFGTPKGAQILLSGQLIRHRFMQERKMLNCLGKVSLNGWKMLVKGLST